MEAEYIGYYNSILGQIMLTSDKNGLTGLWFENSKYCPDKSCYIEKNIPIFDETKRWLDIYFSGKNPDFTPKLKPKGSTFQNKVWEILKTVPYGKTITYKEISEQIARKTKSNRMSAQAVGGAVGHNKISIIIPCHRVIGCNGHLTGYAAGLPIKETLLKLERSDYFDTADK